jgi:hypothetical protein
MRYRNTCGRSTGREGAGVALRFLPTPTDNQRHHPFEEARRGVPDQAGGLPRGHRRPRVTLPDSFTDYATFLGWDGAGNAFYEPRTQGDGRVYINLPKWSVVILRRK